MFGANSDPGEDADSFGRASIPGALAGAIQAARGDVKRGRDGVLFWSRRWQIEVWWGRWMIGVMGPHAGMIVWSVFLGPFSVRWWPKAGEVSAPISLDSRLRERQLVCLVFDG